MSKTRTEIQKNPVTHSNAGRRVGESTTGWRCPQCTFHNTADICTMCQEPKPKVIKSSKPSQKPVQKFEEKKAKPPKQSPDVYYDPKDGSFNVPIAGIKKYDHKPGKNEIKPHPKEEVKKGGSNIVTIDQLKSSKPERKLDGKRDLLGMLQDAASDEPLPCMRKNQKDKNNK